MYNTNDNLNDDNVNNDLQQSTQQVPEKKPSSRKRKTSLSEADHKFIKDFYSEFADPSIKDQTLKTYQNMVIRVYEKLKLKPTDLVPGNTRQEKAENLSKAILEVRQPTEAHIRTMVAKIMDYDDNIRRTYHKKKADPKKEAFAAYLKGLYPKIYSEFDRHYVPIKVEEKEDENVNIQQQQSDDEGDFDELHEILHDGDSDNDTEVYEEEEEEEQPKPIIKKHKK